MSEIGVGLFGANGHQVLGLLKSCPAARLVAVSGIGNDAVKAAVGDLDGVVFHDSLEALLADERVELVSLCSPVRAEQEEHAVRCMEQGKHVYAEKPCALTEAGLDRLIEVARRCGVAFHEMAGTAFEQPYREMAAVVRRGEIGTVVQVLAQKSYPYADWRPQDERLDGGLLLQVGVHAVRMVEHVAGVPCVRLSALETKLGNPKDGELRMAISMTGALANGGTASLLANYLNMPGIGSWGNETLRIFGTKGFVEAVDGGQRTRLVVGNEDRGALELREPALEYFNMYVESLAGGPGMPMDLETELHPTRMVIRAREAVESAQEK